MCEAFCINCHALSEICLYIHVAKPEPIILLVLHVIIPFRNSRGFYPLFLVYSHTITCDNDIHNSYS